MGCLPSPGDLPDPGIKPTTPELAGRFSTTEPPEEPIASLVLTKGIIIPYRILLF